MRTRDFEFDLPSSLIAQYPLPDRGASRLLAVNAATGKCSDHQFTDLVDLLRPEDLLVLNDTRVLKARLFGRKSSGGEVEVLVERVVDDHNVLALVRAGKSPRAGAELLLGDGAHATVLGRDGGLFRLRFDGEPVIRVLDRCGQLPLPPYINRAADTADEHRYQTVYASVYGAAAAPTAGLHFDQPIFDALAAKGVRTAVLTLHVGAATFQPVRGEDVDEHRMHAERYWVPEVTASAVRETRRRRGRVIAVGTTCVRALESAAEAGEFRAHSGDTRIFITPGFEFRVVDGLVTNFHLPRSTLLMLVSAFAGRELILAAYAHAVRQQYRFFSYGDAMFLTRGPA